MANFACLAVVYGLCLPDMYHTDTRLYRFGVFQLVRTGKGEHHRAISITAICASSFTKECAGVLNCTGIVKLSIPEPHILIEICATCVFPNSRFTIELCTSYDSSSRTGINSNSIAPLPIVSTLAMELKTHLGVVLMTCMTSTELAGSSEFGITVIGIGDLYPLRNNRSLSTLPEVLQSMFNHTLNTNSFLINTAATELQGSEIAAIYLCINTRKQWMPFLQVLSATLGSSMGVFAAAFSVIVMLARRFDSRHKKEEDRVRRSESIRNTSISNVREGEEIPLTKITEQD
ncbi:hypothetical protein KEM48_006759 [Puccinia striiformis f. sp. tritici PST-130]|nr:hypothetical protein KEM48_006759 [Puccinia striiformis f. sp. tritici PST-130]